ncbi:electron transport complex subunit RsxC [Oceanospirillum linum]|uniref:Ion-translocating oxidoreductase complex subunit C n=1 Tax=Oceanospirillum linum TaxID=966 RepID=A0A1T1HEG0_OCELI|nr:electron transport complex subunit RsxC [Oceanospirillum linum]OOV88120.1 electron transport complex subunit RsxC [Oceanospirillum linum]SEF43721.1 electron transport complex protein RnfC [Oleiphilus messinensis]SMP01444.1 electron transport complex protein RnfC [Oceanospirillum linum]
MRTLWDFHGGIHPQENKQQSVQQPITKAPLPSKVVLPLQQHIGAPAEPLVNIGDSVKTGQLIARADGFISANIHASISGTITAIGEHPIPHASGMDDLCITIESDGKDEWTMLEPVSDWQNADVDTLLQAISKAGIVGMGGAGFPTAVKARTRERHAIDTLVINAAECEPYITADDMAMRTYPQQLVLGAQILCKLVDPSSCLIGIEDNKPEAIKALQTATQGTHIDVVVIPTKYPSGGEKQLIQILTGREVPSGGLPADIGVVCQNVGTAIAIAKAVTLGEPLISRITTLTGNAMTRRQNVEVRLGTPIRELLEYAGFNADRASRLIMGGPMMGFTLTSDQLPVVKTTNCLLAPTHQEFPDPEPESPCIRCGMCEQACPADLLPQQLHWFAKAEEFEKAQLFNLFDCIECGACAYVCPSSIPLVQYYRFAKTEIRNEQEEAKKAERAKIRFEQRQARLEREEAEKIAARNARMAAAAAKTSATASTSAPAPAANGLDEAAAKKLKIQRAAASVALKKAEKALAEATDDNRSKLEADLKAAQDKVTTIDAQLSGSTSSGSSVPATAPAQASNPNGLDEAALKKLKIQRAAASVALKKAEKALAEASDEDKAKLETDLKAAQEKVSDIEKQLGIASAPTASAPAQAAPAAANEAQAKALKQAKIAVAASKAAIKKAEKALIHAQRDNDPDEVAAKEAAILTAKANAVKAEEKLKTLEEHAKAAPPPSSQAQTASAAQSDSADQEKALKQAKIAAAASKAAIRKAEKALTAAQESGDAEQVAACETKLTTVKEKAQQAADKLAALQNATMQPKADAATTDAVADQEKALKQAKIAAAASKAAIRKAEKALTAAQESGDAEQVAACEAKLTTTKEKAQQAADKLATLQNTASTEPNTKAQPSTPTDSAADAQAKALKQAKIIAAATKTALKKAEKTLAETEASGDAQAISDQQAVVERCKTKYSDAAQKLEQLTQSAGSEV